MVENGAQTHPKQHKEESLNGGLPAASEILFFFFFLLHTTHGQHIKYPPFESENFPREKISARVKDAKRGQFIYDTTC